MKIIIIYNILLTIGFIVLSSRSCESDTYYMDEESRSQSLQESTLSNIKSQFEAETLSEDQLMIYNKKAREKILDFTDYMSLYSDKDLDNAFKEQIKDVMYRLFSDHDAVVELSVGSEYKAEQINNTLIQLLNNIDESEYQSVDFTISGLKDIELLHFHSTGKYTGKISCEYKITGETGSDTTILYENTVQINIVATLTSKQFGENTSLMIWQVFLGDILEKH